MVKKLIRVSIKWEIRGVLIVFFLFFESLRHFGPIPLAPFRVVCFVFRGWPQLPERVSSITRGLESELKPSPEFRFGVHR